MATVYIPDDLMHEIMALGKNKSEFVKMAIKERLKMVKKQ